jgi:hypothetical protein
MGDLGMTHSTHQERKHRALGEEMSRKDLLRFSGIERKIILKLFLQKYNISVWYEMIRPRPRICAWALQIQRS